MTLINRIINLIRKGCIEKVLKNYQANDPGIYKGSKIQENVCHYPIMNSSSLSVILTSKKDALRKHWLIQLTTQTITQVFFSQESHHT